MTRSGYFVVLGELAHAMLYRGGSGVGEGARFGALVGAYAVGSFVLHNLCRANFFEGGTDGDR